MAVCTPTTALPKPRLVSQGPLTRFGHGNGVTWVATRVLFRHGWGIFRGPVMEWEEAHSDLLT